MYLIKNKQKNKYGIKWTKLNWFDLKQVCTKNYNNNNNKWNYN